MQTVRKIGIQAWNQQCKGMKEWQGRKEDKDEITVNRCKLGEIDIIARDGDYLVFCEVKYRADDRKGTPAEAVDYAKQRVISKSALYYMTVNGIDEIPCRFDVVSIEDDRIILYQNAFDYVEI